MTRCLLPTDGSDLATHVVGPLRRLLGDDLSEVILLRVVPVATASEQGDAIDEATAELQATRDQLGLPGTVTLRVARGDPAEQILAVADEVDARLIAMTSHGRSGIQRVVRGSVAERVLRHAKAPLLVANPTVEPPTEGYRKLLVPLDGSELSESILDHVLRLAQAFSGCSVTLLRVEPFLYSALPSPALNPDLWDAEATRQTLNPARERLAAAGLTVETTAAYGVESAEILQAAHDHDLVVMSTHGRSGPSRWWFGSVAETVLRHCDRPLYVVRSA